MLRFKFILLLFIQCITVSAFAATITGKVTDEKGLPLPFATVYVQGSTIGTSANADGFYTLSLQPGSYKLICQYIGFKQGFFNITVTGNETVKHDFTLSDHGMQLKGVVVKATDEDPAYRIIRNVIKRRSFHAKQMRSFQTSVYVKGVLRNRAMPDNIMGVSLKVNDKEEMKKGMGLDSNGKGVIYLCEEIADYYAAEPNKTKVIIHSVKESGDPQGVGLGSVPTVVNVYENNIDLFRNLNPRGFISPISNNALLYYKYKLEHEFKEGDVTIYKIKVIPKRAYEPCFAGDIYIVDNDWAVHSVKLLVTQKMGLNMLDTVQLEQQYIPLKADVWVIKNQVLYPTISLFGFDVSGSFVTVYDNQKVNEPIPDSIFNRKVITTYDNDANKKDTLFWQTVRPMQLEADEQKDYVYKDSIRLIDQDPHRLDSIRRKGNKIGWGSVFMSGINLSGKGYKNRVGISPVLWDINFNPVEGLNYAPSVLWTHKVDTGKELTAKTTLRYGFSNTHFNAKESIRYTQSDRHWAGRSWSIGLSGGKYISQYNSLQPVPELFNTSTALFSRRNYFNIYERWFASATAARNYGNGFAWSAGMSYQQRLPLENTTDYTWAKKSSAPYANNVPVELQAMTWEKHEAFIAKASISFSPGYTYTQFPGRKVPHGSKWPVFTLQYQKGIPGVGNSKTDFDKWKFSIKDNVSLKLMGSLEYNISAGGFLNDKYVSLPDMMHLTGNQFTLTPSYLDAFQLAPYYRYSNTAKIYGEAHVEYYMKGLLTNKIPLLRKTNCYFVLGNNTFYADQHQYYTESFIGIDNLGYKILRIFRFDFVYGLDGAQRTYSGFRIGIHTSGLSKVVKSDVDNDF